MAEITTLFEIHANISVLQLCFRKFKTIKLHSSTNKTSGAVTHTDDYYICTQCKHGLVALTSQIQCSSLIGLLVCEILVTVSTLYLDFINAFDKILQIRLLDKTARHRISGRGLKTHYLSEDDRENVSVVNT